jgi:hypothetical protein
MIQDAPSPGLGVSKIKKILTRVNASIGQAHDVANAVDERVKITARSD